MGKKKEKKIQHYSSSQKILLVGEGNFSFSACLAKAFGSATNMVATCLHSKDALRRKHQSSGPHLAELKSRGCLVLYEINVCDMDQNPSLMSMKFDVIIFNFPHAGHCGLNETDRLLIECAMVSDTIGGISGLVQDVVVQNIELIFGKLRVSLILNRVVLYYRYLSHESYVNLGILNPNPSSRGC